MELNVKLLSSQSLKCTLHDIAIKAHTTNRAKARLYSQIGLESDNPLTTKENVMVKI